MSSSIAHLVRTATSLAVRGVLLLIVIEGTASLVGFALSLASGLQPSERARLHMRFDPELGWTSVPDTRLENFYGPGRHLTINGQGARAQRAYEAAPPAGKHRAVCAGDAFTLGPGVDDSATWCAQLEQMESQLETVNLGQGGYGVDQSFLRVRREGEPFAYDLLLFAFVRDNFARMEKDSFHHYAKPFLRIGASGELDVRNVPVPNNGERMPWLVRNESLFERLRIVELARPAIRALRPRKVSELTAGDLADLSGEVFEELARLAQQRGARLVLVNLPTFADYDHPGELWRTRLAREARKREIPFVDLVLALRELARSDAASLYAQSQGNGRRSSETPYSEAGHAWVAEALRDHLHELPAVARLLEAPRAQSDPATLRATRRGP